MQTSDKAPLLSRRAALTGGAALASVGAIAGRGWAADAPGPIMTRLSSFMGAAATAPLPPEVVEKTKQMILDTLAAMISGTSLPPGQFALNFARLYRNDRGCTVVGSNLLCSAVEAALVNGMLAHSDETDDTLPASQSHPGCSIVPSALAAGEQFGASGERLIRAVALGYDVGPRVTETLGKLQYMVSTHRSTHAISGSFGSAAAAACMAGLTAAQMRWVLSYTAQAAGGLASWQRDPQHFEKAYDFGGLPARNGTTAALLVQAGGTALDDIFSGPDNFLQAFQPLNPPEMLIEGLGKRYEITRTDVKKWTVGAPIQAPLDALFNILQKHPLDPDKVRKISVRVASDEAVIVDNREIPDICLQHLIAVMLLDRTVSFKSAHDEPRLRDPAVLRQRAKVELVHDAELETLMPKRVAVVTVTLADGSVLTERVETVRGTSGNPMTRDEMIAKARDLIVPVLGATNFEHLVDRIFALETVANVAELRPLLQRA